MANVSDLTKFLYSIVTKRSRITRTEHRGVGTVDTTREKLSWQVTATLAAPSYGSVPGTFTRWNNGDTW